MKQIVATMAGTIFQIQVEKGEEVKKGQVAIVLESMKMEIPIESDMDGIVKEIYVQIGDFVNEGDVLITLE